MMRSFLAGVKKILLWSYERGSWQYDVLCILILLFIFLTPADWYEPAPDEQRVEESLRAPAASPVPDATEGPEAEPEAEPEESENQSKEP